MAFVNNVSECFCWQLKALGSTRNKGRWKCTSKEAAWLVQIFLMHESVRVNVPCALDKWIR